MSDPQMQAAMERNTELAEPTREELLAALSATVRENCMDNRGDVRDTTAADTNAIFLLERADMLVRIEKGNQIYWRWSRFAK